MQPTDCTNRLITLLFIETKTTKSQNIKKTLKMTKKCILQKEKKKKRKKRGKVIHGVFGG